jgi:hypothetical protein
MTNLFAQETGTNGSVGAIGLAKTAALTAHSTRIANELLAKINKHDMTEDMEQKVKASMSDHDVMDQLIDEVTPLENEDVEYLKTETEDTLDKMLKSQQSKRSRTKGKVMTMDNYRTMLIGAIAENLLRIALNKPKNANNLVDFGNIALSDDELMKLSMSPELLRNAIRNIQSKKSIAKSKIGFSVDSDKWQALLLAEQQLKDLRDATTSQITSEAIDQNNQIKTVLADIGDLSSMKGQQAKDLLAKVIEIAGLNVTIE